MQSWIRADLGAAWPFLVQWQISSSNADVQRPLQLASPLCLHSATLKFSECCELKTAIDLTHQIFSYDCAIDLTPFIVYERFPALKSGEAIVAFCHVRSSHNFICLAGGSCNLWPVDNSRSRGSAGSVVTRVAVLDFVQEPYPEHSFAGASTRIPRDTET